MSLFFRLYPNKVFTKFDTLFHITVRDWSLITGRGGYKTGGGHVKFYPYRKRGAEKVLAMLKGGHNKFWGSFYVVA